MFHKFTYFDINQTKRSCKKYPKQLIIDSEEYRMVNYHFLLILMTINE